MERPTKEQVDGMLGRDVYDVDVSTAKAIAESLQAEVRALREELARVQALPAKWRDDYKLAVEHVSAHECAHELAQELEFALAVPGE